MTHFKVLSIRGDANFPLNQFWDVDHWKSIGSRKKRLQWYARFNGNFPARSLVFCSCAHLSLIFWSPFFLLKPPFVGVPVKSVNWAKHSKTSNPTPPRPPTFAKSRASFDKWLDNHMASQTRSQPGTGGMAPGLGINGRTNLVTTHASPSALSRYTPDFLEVESAWVSGCHNLNFHERVWVWISRVHKNPLSPWTICWY